MLGSIAHEELESAKPLGDGHGVKIHSGSESIQSMSEARVSETLSVDGQVVFLWARTNCEVDLVRRMVADTVCMENAWVTNDSRLG